ncbi:MAG TPA: hypothetical protein VGL38_14850 [bacterium]
MKSKVNISEKARNAGEERRLWMLLAGSAGTFDTYFPARVMARLHSRQPEDEWIAGLLVAFRRVALVATILTGLLVSYNIVTQWEARRDLNAVEITLAIPPATIQSSLDHMDFGL